MRIIRRTTQFKKDVKRMERRGKKFVEFKEVIGKLVVGTKLESKFKDHYLVGQYIGSRECHIEPDWLLVYELTDDDLVLVRTGTHSDLFR